MATEREGGGITLVIFDSRIREMTLAGGLTFRWALRLAREVELVASTKLFPGHGYRSGVLRRSLGSSATPIFGPGVIGSARADAEHAYWYHEGAAAKDSATGMKFFGTGVYTRAKPYFSYHFRGYDGTPFLEEAKREVLGARGLL